MRYLLFGLCLVCGLTAEASAATHKLPPEDPFAAVTLPDEWQLKHHGEGIEVISPEGGFHVFVIPGEGRKTNETIGEVMRYIRRTGGIRVRADSLMHNSGELNGRKIRELNWEGKDSKGTVAIHFTVISFGKTEPLILACWGAPEADQKYQAEFKKIVRSVTTP